MNGLKREYFKYISLNIMGMLGLSCYILADTYFVSNRMGTNGLAALNLAIAVYSLIHGTGLMIGIGGATRYTISRSQGKTRRASEAFWDSLVLGMAAAAFFMAPHCQGGRKIQDSRGVRRCQRRKPELPHRIPLLLPQRDSEHQI